TRRYISCHYASRSDKRAFADNNPRQDCCIGTDRSSATDGRVEKLRRTYVAARISVIGEGRVRPDEDIVLEANPVPQLHAALDRDPVADKDIVLNEDVVADVAVRADRCAWKHVGERPDAGTGADVAAFAEPLWMHVHAHQWRPSEFLNACQPMQV